MINLNSLCLYNGHVCFCCMSTISSMVVDNFGICLYSFTQYFMNILLCLLCIKDAYYASLVSGHVFFFFSRGFWNLPMWMFEKLDFSLIENFILVCQNLYLFLGNIFIWNLKNWAKPQIQKNHCEMVAKLLSGFTFSHGFSCFQYLSHSILLLQVKCLKCHG